MSQTRDRATLDQLYETDMNVWCLETAACLQSGDLHRLDIEHLIEEIEGLANRDRRELKNRLRLLLTHLLKRLYIDSTYDNRDWERTMYSFLTSGSVNET